jgi:putative endonuclease
MNRRLRAHRFGLAAEWMCAALLMLKGYRVLGLRIRTPVGEVDIAARKGDTLVVVEVKARRSEELALESVTYHKRARLMRAAEALRLRFPGETPNMRFDVMTVLPWRLPRHLKDAWR